MNIPSVILESLKACPTPPTPDNRWRYAYELIVGAAASLLSAHPHYVGTSHYDRKKLYDFHPEILHNLLREAHKEAAIAGRPIDLYYDGLEVWTTGYFFNSGIMRIACAYEYTVSTACSNAPYATLNLEKDMQLLKQKHPPPELEKQLEVIRLLKDYAREKLNNEVNELIAGLVGEISPTEQEQMSSLYERLGSKDDDFFKAALFFVWCDYNWFKHRPMGYPRANHPRKDPCIQFALAVRAYRGLCDFYSWCHTLNLAPKT